ncbi:MAG: hypothetical protein ACRCTJ_06175 [Brevinema sp.]
MKFLPIMLLTVSISFAQTTNYNLTVSQGDFNNKVELSWFKISGADYYNVERSYDAPKKTRRGKVEKIPVDILVSKTSNTSYTDSSISFGMHQYVINAYQISNNTSSIIVSLTNTGFRKVTDKEFFLEFQKAIDSSLPRIRTMKMLNFFGEKKKGWRGGQLIYKTTGIIKRPFKVMIDYRDFIDQGLKINGLYEVQIFKLLAQEGKLVGTFQVDGIYQGTITHNLIINGGQSVGGTYDVQQKDKEMVSLPWNITDHPLDDSQYEENLKGTIKESKNPQK